MKIQEVRRNNASHRVSIHSHVKNLGIGYDGSLIERSNSIVGQEAARIACGIVVDMVRARKMAGRAVLLAGPSGSGKTALAMAMAGELGPNVPFCHVVGSEVYSSEVKKTEILMECFRKSIGIRVKETKEVYEGEVNEISPNEVESSINTYTKMITHVVIGLKTSKGTKQLKLDPTIYDNLIKEGVQVGDIIYIEANNGSVKRLGRSDAYASEFDLEADQYVPMPKGDVHKKKEIVQDITLHDLDAANSTPQGGQDILTMINQILKPKKTEMTDKLRYEINKVVNSYIDQGIAELIPGVLFIDEVHILDLECFTFLHKVMESNIAPIIVLASNRGLCTVRGSDIVSPHGVPQDFLDRLSIINTQPYKPDELSRIISIRAYAENIPLDDECISYLTEIASKSSLRYAIQLLAPSLILATDAGRPELIQTDDISEAKRLFLDYKLSSSMETS